MGQHDDRLGLLGGMREALGQLRGEGGSVPALRHSRLCALLNQRVYLYPIALFKSAASIQGLDDYRVADEDEIYVYGRIAVLPIGLFLLHENGFEKLDRQLLERDVTYLMEKLCKGKSLISVAGSVLIPINCKKKVLKLSVTTIIIVQNTQQNALTPLFAITSSMCLNLKNKPKY